MHMRNLQLQKISNFQPFELAELSSSESGLHRLTFAWTSVAGSDALSWGSSIALEMNG